MKYFRIQMLIILLGSLSFGIKSSILNTDSNKPREQTDNWARELLLSDMQSNMAEDPYDMSYPRSLKSKNKKTRKISKKNKLSKESDKLKSEVQKLKKKLKVYKRKLKKHKRKGKKAKLTKKKEIDKNNVEDQKNKKIFRHLVLNSIFESNNNNRELNVNKVDSQTLQSSPNMQQQMMGNYTTQTSPNLNSGVQEQSQNEAQLPFNKSDLSNLMVKHLTVNDFDKIAQRKLTVENYQQVVSGFDGLSPEQKKQRYLSGLLNSIPKLIDTLMSSITTAGKTLTETLTDPDHAKTISGLALGTGIGLKYNKYRKFYYEKTKLSKDIEMYENMNAVLEDQKTNLARATDEVSTLVGKTKSISSNLGYRFMKKIEIFSITPY